MNIKPPKMTPLEKAEQRRGSRFVRVIPSTKWQAYSDNPPEREYDDKGRRVK